MYYIYIYIIYRPKELKPNVSIYIYCTLYIYIYMYIYIQHIWIVRDVIRCCNLISNPSLNRDISSILQHYFVITGLTNQLIQLWGITSYSRLYTKSRCASLKLYFPTKPTHNIYPVWNANVSLFFSSPSNLTSPPFFI